MNYVTAIRTAIKDEMSANAQMLIMGQGVWSPFYVGSSMDGIEETFGRSRVLDTPVSENAVTGVAVGAALSGATVLLIHPRMDFALLAMDSIVNGAAKWRYSLDQQIPLPLTIRVIINRGGEQGAQHSQALHSWFAHIPGLRVVMPSTARDAYYLLRASIQSKDPVIFVEDRWDYEEKEEFELQSEIPSLNLIKPKVVNAGSLVTVVGIGHTTNIARRIVSKLSGGSKLIEVIDLRTVQPLDPRVIIESVKKTKRLVVVDGSWKNAGMAGEVIASVMESLEIPMLAPPIRITLPDAPAPTSKVLEDEYYGQEDQLEKVLTNFMDF